MRQAGSDDRHHHRCSTKELAPTDDAATTHIDESKVVRVDTAWRYKMVDGGRRDGHHSTLPKQPLLSFPQNAVNSLTKLPVTTASISMLNVQRLTNDARGRW